MRVLHPRCSLVALEPSWRVQDHQRRRSFAKGLTQRSVLSAKGDCSPKKGYDWEALSRGTLDEALKTWQAQMETETSAVVEILRPDDVRAASRTIAQVFYEPSPFFPSNGFFAYLFEADVLGGIQASRRYRSEDDFLILVAREKRDAPIVGAVQVSRQGEDRVLQYLPTDVKSYAYISSMAVLPEKRRQGIGSALLSAAEFVAWLWAESEIVLHMYKDNSVARELYTNRGYEEISTPPNDGFGILPKGREILLLRRQW